MSEMLSVLCFVLLLPCLSPSLFPSSPNRSLRCVQAVGFHCFSDRARRKSLWTMCSLFIFLAFSLFLSNSLALLFGHASAQHCMAFRSGKITHSLSPPSNSLTYGLLLSTLYTENHVAEGGFGRVAVREKEPTHASRLRILRESIKRSIIWLLTCQFLQWDGAFPLPSLTIEHSGTENINGFAN